MPRGTLRKALVHTTPRSDHESEHTIWRLSFWCFLFFPSHLPLTHICPLTGAPFAPGCIQLAFGCWITACAEACRLRKRLLLSASACADLHKSSEKTSLCEMKHTLNIHTIVPVEAISTQASESSQKLVRTFTAFGTRSYPKHPSAEVILNNWA